MTSKEPTRTEQDCGYAYWFEMAEFICKRGLFVEYQKWLHSRARADPKRSAEVREPRLTEEQKIA